MVEVSCFGPNSPINFVLLNKLLVSVTWQRGASVAKTAILDGDSQIGQMMFTPANQFSR